jgi:hypothetical protein
VPGATPVHSQLALALPSPCAPLHPYIAPRIDCSDMPPIRKVSVSVPAALVMSNSRFGPVEVEGCRLIRQ